MKNFPYGLIEGYKVSIPYPFTLVLSTFFPPSIFIKA